MIEHATQWLGAYLDGELKGVRLHQVETHLAQCAACRMELEQLRKMSALLHTPDPSGRFQPTGRFVNGLMLRLPRRPERIFRRPAAGFVHWLVPAGILGTWFLFQFALGLGGLISAAGDAGLLGSVTAWLPSIPQQTTWFGATLNVFGSQLGGSGKATLDLLNQADLFLTNVIVLLAIQFGLAMVYWTWLALFWRHQRNTVHPSLPNSPTSSS